VPQDHYARQSTITNPGACARLLDNLPCNVADLVPIIQGLLIHPGAARLQKVRPSHSPNNGFGIRLVSDMLATIRQINDAPLTVPRPAVQKSMVNCRNFAVLLVAMLRHQGIPARLRVGFASYFDHPLHFEHRLCQYWDATNGRWVFVDAQIEESQRRAYGIRFNTLDVGPDAPFQLAGWVWRACRAGTLPAEQFADSPTDRGFPMIRYALLHDFDALNKIELLGCDAWHPLIDKPEAEVTAADRRLLDDIADLTLAVDTNLLSFRHAYGTMAYGRTVQETLQKKVKQ